MIVAVLTTFHTQYTSDRSKCFFYLTEQHSKCLLHNLQVLYMCTLCDSTNINTIIEFVPHVSGDGFNGGSESYLHFRDTHAPCILKLCIPPSNGIVRWWLFPEFGAELPLDNCTPTIILNNPVFWLISCLGLVVYYLMTEAVSSVDFLSTGDDGKNVLVNVSDIIHMKPLSRIYFTKYDLFHGPHKLK